MLELTEGHANALQPACVAGICLLEHRLLSQSDHASIYIRQITDSYAPSRPCHAGHGQGSGAHFCGEDILCDSLPGQRLSRMLCSHLGTRFVPQLLCSALQLLHVCQRWPPPLLELKLRAHCSSMPWM